MESLSLTVKLGNRASIYIFFRLKLRLMKGRAYFGFYK